MSFKQSLIDVYDKKYKQLLLLSFLLLFVCVGFLVFKFVTTGDVVERGVSLKGGITMTIPVENAVDVHELQSFLSNRFPKADISVRSLAESGKLSALIVEAADVDEDFLISAISSYGIVLERGKFSLENMGSSLGENFFRQTLGALLIAFLCMSLVVYATFRIAVPSFFVILAAFSDIVSTLAVISFLDIKLSTAGIAAFLMLIGYSVDTDILLTTKVYKRREGSELERLFSAIKTGLTMTATALVAVLVAYFVTDADVIKQIMFILMVGLVFDVIYTWIQNAGILRWYMEWERGR
ncbi:hypothetical protein HY485_02925 [Candidatus Woesearchaeota archaeon]|nr:hypothetical protein [Candidatus Woesearchaeota archaeon]